MEKVYILSEKELLQTLGQIAILSNYLHGFNTYEEAEQEAKEMVKKLYITFNK